MDDGKREGGRSTDAGGSPDVPGYVRDQLQRALHAAQAHPDPEVQARAREKVARWERVERGIRSGELEVGSRVPVASTPAWVTLEVAHGGFATGAFAAGGPLLPHEQTLLERVPQGGGSERHRLNTYFLSDAGQEELRELLRTGCHRVQVPEEGALLVFTWLVQAGQTERALSLVETLQPFFHLLRFYPVPDALPQLAGPLVHRRTVAQTARALEKPREQTEVQRMNEALTLWLPLRDRAVALFLETVEGAAPTLQCEADGSLVRSTAAKGQPKVQGGWPCQRYPEGWQARARALVDDYAREQKAYPRSAKSRKVQESLAKLVASLERCVTAPRKLSGRDVGAIRTLLAGCAWSEGPPGSPQHTRLRADQAVMARRPLHSQLRRVLVQRLRTFETEAGLKSLEVIDAPLTEEERARLKTEEPGVLPAYLRRKAEQCWLAPVDTLVERGVIPSGEVLAQVVPQITAQVQAAGLTDPALRRLSGAVYGAFRRRRSLLLLNLEHQVTLGELPWVAAMEAQREAGTDAKTQARAAFQQVVELAVDAFPQAIFPNKLLQEFRALAKSAGIELPLVDELAADIFMGSFSEKFVTAARISAQLLEGTLYPRYYGLPYERARGAMTKEEFAGLAQTLAGPAKGKASHVARNGMIIEQSQLLTTQNLATVFQALGLQESLRARFAALAGKAFAWVCRQQRMKVTEWQAQLHRIKNGAYAWRQMLVYLSFLSAEEVAAFVGQCREEAGKLPEAARGRLMPAVEGLALVARGGAFNPEGVGPRGERTVGGVEHRAALDAGTTHPLTPGSL